MTLFRDLPREGWYSMEVYADRLTAALRFLGCQVESYVPPAPIGPRLPGRGDVLQTYFWRMVVYPLLAAKKQRKVNHIVDHSYGHLVYHLDCRSTVVTCHDVAPLVYPDPTARWLSRPLWRYAFRGMLRAAHIIADSESTRRDLLRHSVYPAERISVVHPGVDHDWFHPRSEAEQQAVRDAYALPAKSIVLHVGRCGYRKNVETLLRSFASLHRGGVDAVFVQAGGRFTNAQRQLISELDIQSQVCQVPFVAPEQLSALYSLATVFVFPSWYEGFGLPVLEAMACGTPVIAANTGSLPEVVGDAGLLVAPGNVEEISHVVHDLLANRPMRARLSLKSTERAKQFSWERCAREVMAVYAQLADGR